MTALKTSPRPKKNPARKPKRDTSTEQIADVEFRADLEELLQKDPIARLGFKGGIKYVDEKGLDGRKWNFDNAFYAPKGLDPEHQSLKNVTEANLGDPVRPDDIAYSNNFGASKDILVHEMRHRGINRLKELYEKDPEWFIGEFGPDVVQFLSQGGRYWDEALTEIGDNPDAHWIDDKGQHRSMSETIQMDSNEIDQGIYAAMQKAAEHALNQKYPPKSQPMRTEARSWLGQLFTGEDYKAVPKMAKGGPVEKQMEFMFMKDGGEVDPVSGNEIPPGGTAEGVRDDIDAKVSEGEFVFPENVVRFYGIDKLEKMIQKANDTLTEMEAAGRMGNAPEEEEEELPFDVTELQTTDQAPIAMAEGGPVAVSHVPAAQFENVPYINAQGDRKMILMYNGVPINGIIPAGYFPETPANKKSLQGSQASVTPVTGRNSGDSDTDNDPNATNKANLDVKTWTTDDFENMMKQQGTVDLMAQGLSMAGPGALIGLGVRQGNLMTLNRAAEEIRERLQNPETPDEDRDRLNNVYNELQEKLEDKGQWGGLLAEGLGGRGLLGGLVPGGGLLGGLLPEGGLLGGLFRSVRGGDSGGISHGSAHGGTSLPRRTTSSSSGPSGPRTSTSTRTGGTSVSTTPTSSAPTSSPRPASRTQPSSDRTRSAPTEDYDRTGPMKKGGLVTRRKKK